MLLGWCLRPYTRRGGELTVFDKTDVSDDEFGDRDLRDLGIAQSRESMLELDLALKSAELALFLPVVKRRHQHHDDDREQDGCTLDPPGFRIHVLRCSIVICIEIVQVQLTVLHEALVGCAYHRCKNVFYVFEIFF